jgi:hypothetical protein
MSFNGLTPYQASNPYLANVYQAFPSGAAAYSQDLPTILKNFSGQAVPIVSYPQWNPLGDFLNGGQTNTGFQGLGFPAQWGGATLGGTGTLTTGGSTVNNSLGGGSSNLLSLLGLGGSTTGNSGQGSFSGNTLGTTTQGNNTNTSNNSRTQLVTLLLQTLLGGGNGLLA